jgi:RNA-binding protein YhbY
MDSRKGLGGSMKILTSTQAKYLRGIAEIIKIRFIDYKEKKQKTEIARTLEGHTGSHLAGMIGHIAILYRQHHDPEKRKIILPN